MATVEAPPLLAWLETQIGADEQRARCAAPGAWTYQDIASAGGGRVCDPIIGIAHVHYDVDHVDLRIRRAVHEREADATGAHIATWDPVRGLAECAAKRRVLTRHTPVIGGVIASSVRLTDTEWQTVKDRWAEHDNRNVVLVDLDDGMPPHRVAQVVGACSWCTRPWPCPDVLDVAVVYQDRDGWHDGWAPRG